MQEIADRSLTLLRNDGVLPVARERLATAVNLNVQKADVDAPGGDLVSLDDDRNNFV